MTIDEVLIRIREAHPDLTAFGVKSLAVFGSVARGQATNRSDVDILVDFASPATFNGYMGLKLKLEEILGLPVDLVTMRALRPELREEILHEAVRVA